MEILVKFAGQVVENCGKLFYFLKAPQSDEKIATIKETPTHYLISCLLLTYINPFSDISSLSASYLQNFKKENENEFSEIIFDNLNEFFDGQESFMIKKNENQKKSTMIWIRNQIFLLGNKIETFLDFSAEKFLNFFLEFLKLNKKIENAVHSTINSNVHLYSSFQLQFVDPSFKSEFFSEFFYNFSESQEKIIEKKNEIYEKLENPKENLIFPVPNFYYFMGEDIYITICEIFNLIGFFSENFRILDELIKIFSTESHFYKNPTILLMNQFIYGKFQTFVTINSIKIEKKKEEINKKLNVNYFEILINEFLSDENFNSLKHKNDHLAQPTQKNIQEIQEKILLNCFLMEGLGIFAEILKEDFKIYLMKILLILFIKLADKNQLISNYSWTSLNRICYHLNYANIRELIKENSDYLLDKISIQLKFSLFYSETLKALKSLFIYSDAHLLTFVYDLSSDILNCLDFLHSDHLFPLVETLKYLIFSLYRLQCEFPEAFVQISKNNGQSENENESDPENELEEFSTGKLVTKQAPKPIQAVLDILNKIQHFLPNKQRKIKILCLDIVYVGIIILRKDYINKLLPLIHTMWGPLVNRLNESEDVAVFIKVLQVIKIASYYCQDFLRDKVITNVWPFIKAKLKENFAKFYQPKIKDTIQLQHQSQYKIQISILNCLFYFINYVDRIPTEIIYDIVQETSIYLIDKQPTDFQDCGIQIFKGLIKQNPDAMWLILGNMASQHLSYPEESNASLNGFYQEITFPAVVNYFQNAEKYPEFHLSQLINNATLLFQYCNTIN